MKYDHPVPAAAVEVVVLEVVVETLIDVVEEDFVDVTAVVVAVPGRH